MDLQSNNDQLILTERHVDRCWPTAFLDLQGSQTNLSSALLLIWDITLINRLYLYISKIIHLLNNFGKTKLLPKMLIDVFLYSRWTLFR